jgi:hypothetical protein
MPHLNAVPNDALPQRCRFTSTDSIRRRALARLYERRSAVDELIHSLERYQGEQSARLAKCVEITAGKK